MDAAACDGPDDCWFAGIGSEDPSGQHVGAFHLHWNGTSLISSYQPQGRGVSGLAFFDGTFYESTFVGTQEGDTTGPVTLATPEPDGPVLIHKLVDETFTDVGFLPYPYPGVSDRRHRAAVRQVRRQRPVVLRRRRRLWPGGPQGRLGSQSAAGGALLRRLLPAGPDRHLAVRSGRPLRRRRPGARQRKPPGSPTSPTRSAAARRPRPKSR